MSSRHPRLQTLPDGFFRRIDSFRALEARIARLPEELCRGDAFEVFVEAYLRTTAVWQVEDLWLVGQIPLDIRKTLNLPKDAKGIDGVIRTRRGELVPYQVKFRIDRPQVCVAEVATFLGLTDRAGRVLISNCDRFAGDITVRDRLRMLRGSDFDALTAADFIRISQWLEGKPARPSRAIARPHQRKVLKDIATTLKAHNRATVVMPCGTGKTLVELWAAEQQSPNTVLVLVPSLALLSQALADWSMNTQWGDRFEYLCVCSDPSVSSEVDGWHVRSTDVPFQVDTSPAQVRRFLDPPKRGEVRVVFSTYQSAPIVARAMRRGGTVFDVGIFDEAHKTTGPGNGAFAFPLDDRNLPIRKRLFFTATPRHIDIRHRDREGDFRVVSMDDPDIYGPRAHTQTFADAVSQGIICDYRVVVPVVDPEEITAFALEYGMTLVDGDQQATRWVATQIAVTKAIRETGATKVITFHTRVSYAQAFAGAPPRGIQQHLDDFIVDHVNGTQRVADRRAILAGFKDERKRLVTNARCLTEGVDLPAVDMVVFSNPRKSRVDIVQAVGRAMRRPRGANKVLGYVVVPVMLAPHQTADIAAACASTDWEDVVDVLAALRDQDSRLDEIIRDQQIAKGRGRAFNPRTLSERVQALGPAVALAALEQHIFATIVERLGETWDEMYGRLVAFRDRVGHAHVPHSYADDPRLGRWCSTQRQDYRKQRLSSRRTARLNDLGFSWNTLESQWEERFVELCAFRSQYGHTRVSHGFGASAVLIKWCREQRIAYKEGSLTATRQRRLEAAGFSFVPYGVAWERRFNQLLEFWHKHGHTRPPKNFHVKGLRSWCGNQRTARAMGRLPVERAARLEAINFEWQDGRWDEMFRHLMSFVRAHGHAIVPHTGDTRLLAKWVAYQRRQVRTRALPPDKVEKLAQGGITFDLYNVAWERRYAELRAFFKAEGHSNVPSEDGAAALASWCNNQRTLRKKASLRADRISRLDELHFLWNRRDASWSERYAELADFQRLHGHANVPDSNRSRSKLSKWCSVQRQFRKRGKLSRERVAMLDALGFAWRLRKGESRSRANQ